MNKGVGLNNRVVALALTVQLLSPVIAPGQTGAFTISPILKRGDPVLANGRYVDCNDCEGGLLGAHAFNNLEDVALWGESPGSCVGESLLVSGKQTIRLADICIGTPWGFFRSLGPVNINDLGEAAVHAGPLTDGRIINMLFLHSDGELRKVVAEGDPTPVGTIFKGCGFSEPVINNQGDIAFSACTESQEGRFRDGVFLFSAGEIRKVVTSQDPSPIGGEFALNFIPPPEVRINDSGAVLFQAGVIIDPAIPENFGLFLATSDGFKKIEVDGDPMPGGGVVTPRTLGAGDLNNRGEVAFAVGLSGAQGTLGIFLHSDDGIHKVMVLGDPAPTGGTFSAIRDTSINEAFPVPTLNNQSAVVFKAVITGGSARSGLFLASPNAIVKAVAVGDRIPSGEKIKRIHSFALNDFGEVAFFAYGKKDRPLGVFKASPVAPAIASVKLKQKQGALELRVNGSGFITNDSIIEVNGEPLLALTYPAEFRENGGTATRVVSRDSRLEQIITPGLPVEVRVLNRLTNLRSSPASFTR